MTTYKPYDPFDTAFNPPKPAQGYWGQVKINAWPCMLIKGFGKMPYDPKSVDPNTGNEPRRYTAVDIEIIPLPELNLKFDVKRAMLAEFGEWVEVTLPSLKDLGLNSLQAINDAWTYVESVESGRTYEKNGETKHGTALRFVRLFPDEAACRADYQNQNGNSNPQPAPAAAAPSNGSTERETAKKFLIPFVRSAWQKSNKDIAAAQAALGPLLASQPLISKYFTAESPEVLDLLAEMAA